MAKEDKNYSEVHLSPLKLRVGFAIILVVAVSVLIRMTPAIDLYIVNLITSLILSNAINLFVIAGLLIALHLIDLKRYKEKLEKEEEKNVY